MVDQQRESEGQDFASDPRKWAGARSRSEGPEAAAQGRSVLEAAGVDLVALERSVGRPRIDGGQGTPGRRSPRVNVSISPGQQAAIDSLAVHGRSRSDVVRDAIDEYLAAHATTAGPREA